MSLFNNKVIIGCQQLAPPRKWWITIKLTARLEEFLLGKTLGPGRPTIMLGEGKLEVVQEVIEGRGGVMPKYLDKGEAE